MRITTKVIQGNSIANINTNKVLQDKLNNQMATEKKIVRTSDDPVVAIRALRLRTNVSQVTQFYEKNVTDAESWMKVTEDSLTTVSSVITDMIEQCTKGSSEKLTATDRDTILNALKALRDEVYATGNADYAGRSVFTGYRTETTLKYTSAEINDIVRNMDGKKPYQITEQINNDVIDSVTFVNSDFLNGINDVNYSSSTYNTTTEQAITEKSVYRIRLSYDNVDDTDDAKEMLHLRIPCAYTATAIDPDKGFENDLIYYEKDADGNYVETKDITPKSNTTYYTRFKEAVTPIDVVSQNTTPKSPYTQMAEYDESTPKGKKAILIPETGELLISRGLYEDLMNLKDQETTPTFDEGQIQISYEKSTWKKDDLKPEHYFACTDISGSDTIKYNHEYLGGIVEKQSIEYDVGLNQSIRVNTTADEVFTHAIGRDVDDLINSMQAVIDMSVTVERLTKIRDNLEKDADYETNYQVLTDQIDAANKAFTFLKEKNQSLFEGSITKMQKHLDKVNEATTNCGTREKKLDLIKNRLMSQKTNFETLESENENVEITDVALQLKGAELTYQAALMSTSKILQTSLMHYI